MYVQGQIPRNARSYLCEIRRHALGRERVRSAPHAVTEERGLRIPAIRRVTLDNTGDVREGR